MRWAIAVLWMTSGMVLGVALVHGEDYSVHPDSHAWVFGAVALALAALAAFTEKAAL